LPVAQLEEKWLTMDETVVLLPAFYCSSWAKFKKKLIKGLLPRRDPGGQMYGAFFNYYENCFVMKNYAVGSCYWKTKVTLGAMVRGPSHRLVLPPPHPRPCD